MRCAYSSNIGEKRSINQDAYLVINFTKGNRMCFAFAVADGLGGHRAGEVASHIAVSYIEEHLSELQYFTDYEKVNEFVNVINQQIIQESLNSPENAGMATTLALCVADGDLLSVVNVGDSRVYQIDDHELRQLTRDHSLVQILVDEGRITPDQALEHPRKNVITRALGTEESVTADLFEYTIDPGSKYLVCSDGLYDMVSEAEIHRIVKENEIEKAVELLVSTANENGGKDNITVILFAPQ